MKPMESLVSLATAVVVAGDDMKSRWCTPTAGGGRLFAYSAICGRLSMLKSRIRFSLLERGRHATRATSQHLLEYVFHRGLRNCKFFKTGHSRRTYGVDLHQFHLVAGNGWRWKHFCDPCQGVPSGEWNWDQCALEAGLTSNDSEKFLVRVDARTAAFERDGPRLRPAQGAYDPASHVFHVRGLQSGEATAEQGIDRKSAQEFEDGGEKRVVRSEHHGGANQ